MPRDAGHGSVEPLFRVMEYDYVWLCHRSVLKITLTAGGVPRRRRMEADRMAAPAVPNVRRYRPAGLHDAAESEARRFAREPQARARAKTDRGHPRSRPDVARSGTGGAAAVKAAETARLHEAQTGRTWMHPSAARPAGCGKPERTPGTGLSAAPVPARYRGPRPGA